MNHVGLFFSSVFDVSVEFNFYLFKCTCAIEQSHLDNDGITKINLLLIIIVSPCNHNTSCKHNASFNHNSPCYCEKGFECCLVSQRLHKVLATIMLLVTMMQLLYSL